ncbi:GWxTD domain-containing protein [candidate division KSB1 bacterium]|nr:GWxTD domain-containing protein [candidate division KSB1 bacterium]RQW04684.1 MAG: GWxTD domain-containing protein [candidate division KSB1 bacterium]
MKTCIRFSLTLILLLAIDAPLAAQTDGAHRLYLEAKKRSFHQEWDMAAQLYAQLVNDYPESHFREEAQFWIGYCLEKTRDYRSAFLAFSTLERKFPNSTWLDDAVQHKIMLAEKLAAQRGDQYYMLLRAQMYHKNKDIQYLAAMALGRLGDRRALGVLESLKGHVDFDSETERVMRQLAQSQDLPDEAIYAEDTIGNLNESQSRERINPREEKVHYFAEHRFEQYKKMARKDDSWSREDLILFGLWHILPSDDFDALLKMDATARTEWLNRFWKRLDPTLTTERNESREEFESRVNIARQFYSYYDGIEDFTYAPWDARGEIYIKFGQPVTRNQAEDGELWSYPQYDRITFLIRPNITNIFGRAIFISSLDGRSMRSVPQSSDWTRWRQLHTKYIFNPGFFCEYRPTDGNELVKDMTLEMRKSGAGLAFRYEMPVSEFKFVEKDGLYHLAYTESYIVLDDQMHNVVRHETTRRITLPNKREMKRQKSIEQEIAVNLAPGDYIIGLRIEDPHSHKIGIKNLDISVK